MSRNFYVNPIQVCSELYGYENLLDVRDCVMESINRFYGNGVFCDYHQVGLLKMIEEYMVQIIKNANRNPNAVKLALPPYRYQARFFVERYLESLDKKKAFNQCMIVCGNNKECQLNCRIDYESVIEIKNNH